MSDTPRESMRETKSSRIWLLPYQLVVLVLFCLITLLTSFVCFIAAVFDRRGDHAHKCLRYWARVCLGVARLDVQVHGLERLNTGETYVFMPNHGSFLDILLTLAYIPHNFRFIILWKLFYNPLLNLALRCSHQLPIDQNSPRQSFKTLQRAMDLLKEKVSIVVFPEGGRSRTSDLQKFKTMVFVLPIRARVPVVPVLIEGAFAALSRGQVLVRPVGIRLTFLDPVVDEFEDSDRSICAARVRTALSDAIRVRRREADEVSP